MSNEQCGPHPIIMCNVVVVNGVQWILKKYNLYFKKVGCINSK
jgi:hypothetical protein